MALTLLRVTAAKIKRELRNNIQNKLKLAEMIEQKAVYKRDDACRLLVRSILFRRYNDLRKRILL